MAGALLWLVVALPLLGFVLLSTGGRRLGERRTAFVGVSTVALAFAVAVVAVLGRVDGVLASDLAPWFSVGALAPRFGLRLDGLSSVFVLVITGVGALIHLHATEYMRGDEGHGRFFAWMNLFVSTMLLLVLADDLLLLFGGWEGVGLCSYVLIGFWYRDPANGRAARKAFIVTRVGDVALLLGLATLFHAHGTLAIGRLVAAATAAGPAGQGVAVVACCLLLGGALGKSAQLPLQVWLPDAMAGPTPVSALIHAATMVTAGVYLVARTHGLFALAPAVLHAIGVIGAATLLLAGLAALCQHDLKRVLAWSTISQLGYMFVALGVGAWHAAIFHMVTHAFFKATLFLSAGSILLALHHERDMRAMGGLRRRLPLVFATFLAGSLALTGFPLVTAGFYSKEAILAGAAGASPALWAAGVVGAALTGLYTFRMVFLVFFGEVRTEPSGRPGWAAGVALVSLATLSIVGGLLVLPDAMSGPAPLGTLLQSALPAGVPREGPLSGVGLAGVAAAASLAGIGGAWLVFGRPRARPTAPARPTRARLARFAAGGFGFDAAYDLLLVRPYLDLGQLNRADVVDRVPAALSWLAQAAWRALSASQRGQLRWALGFVAAGAVFLLALAVWLP